MEFIQVDEEEGAWSWEDQVSIRALVYGSPLTRNRGPELLTRVPKLPAHNLVHQQRWSDDLGSLGFLHGLGHQEQISEQEAVHIHLWQGSKSCGVTNRILRSLKTSAVVHFLLLIFKTGFLYVVLGLAL